uniref:JmjC domain-containing protein n=1 Tax=Caenorhabditis tropicalis TaxID=1561998 RepID=A0A1I7UVJ6_9PELO
MPPLSHKMCPHLRFCVCVCVYGDGHWAKEGGAVYMYVLEQMGANWFWLLYDGAAPGPQWSFYRVDAATQKLVPFRTFFLE